MVTHSLNQEQKWCANPGRNAGNISLGPSWLTWFDSKVGARQNEGSPPKDGSGPRQRQIRAKRSLASGIISSRVIGNCSKLVIVSLNREHVQAAPSIMAQF